MGVVIGVDTGGTFTDTVAIDEDGTISIGKAPSTPPSFWQGVIDSLSHCSSGRGGSLSELLGDCYLCTHGSTVATNAMVTRNGVKTGLITTRGHEDVMSIMRAYGRIAGLPDDQIRHPVATNKPEPIIPKSLRRGVTERVDKAGEVVVHLDEAEASTAIDELLAEGVEAIAVCLLWSFMNNEHELRIRELIRERAPEIPVSLSAELVPVLGEFERASTASVNAYLSKTVHNYYSGLQQRLQESGLKSPPLVVQAAGGLLSIERASERAVSSIGSGPVAGVLASRFLGDQLGFKDIICTDVGGTTFDVGLILNGEPESAIEPAIGQYPIAVPMVEVVSIGSGGGSICQVDSHGILHVGPDSAGALPGPVCIGKGGTKATLTDADLVLGLLDPDYFLGGEMKLDLAAAREAIDEQVAQPLNISIEEAAAGIVNVANAHMADLIRVQTVQRGYDPRDMVLFAYGGAGPVHAAGYGSDIGVVEIVVPVTASLFSAFGAAVSDIHHRYETSRKLPFPCPPGLLMEVFNDLENAAVADLESEGVAPERRTLRREVDLRYHLQIHEVPVGVPGGTLTDAEIASLETGFHEAYEQRYGVGTVLKGGAIEIAKVRVDAIGAVPKPVVPPQPAGDSDCRDAIVHERQVFFPGAGGFSPTPIYRGERLRSGNQLIGPAIIEYVTTSVVVPAGMTADVDPYLSIRLK